MNVHYWAGIVLGFWGASVNKTDKIFGYGVYVLERKVNEQSTMTGEEKLSNIKGVVGGDQGRLPEVVTFERRPSCSEK